MAAGSAGAQVVGFDDVATGYVPTGYNGFAWSNFGIGSGSQYYDTGFLTGTVSGVNYASFLNDGSISAATPFVFNGGYFTAGDDDGDIATVTGSLNGVEVYRMRLPLHYSQATYYLFPSDPITSLVFTHDICNCTNIPVLDNLAFNGASGYVQGVGVQQVATAPEPSSLALLGTGLLAIVPVYRRRLRA